MTGLDPRVVRSASTAVFVTFFLNGFNFAGWASRLPAVRDGLALSPEQLGVLLLVGALGSLGALPLSGLVVQRLGARRTVVGFAVCNAAGLLLAAAGVALGSLWLAAPALVLFGIGTGVWDAAMNLEGASVEQRLGRAIMPRFHAGFSFGTMAGAALGALAAWLGAPVVLHLGIALLLSTAAVVVCARSFLPEAEVPVPADRGAEPIAEAAAAHASAEAQVSAAAAPGADPHAAGGAAATSDGAVRRAGGAWREPRTLLVGLVVLAAALTEGAANDWIGLAVVDGFDTPNEVGAVAFGVFVTAMTAMRLLGTRLLDRFGRVAVLRLSAAMALVGLGVFALVPWLWLALLGAVLWGMGAALGFPVGMSAASDDPRHAPARVAVVATIGYSAFLAGPPLLGFLAEQVGYRFALLAIAVPVLAGLFVVGAARPLREAAGSREGSDGLGTAGGGPGEQAAGGRSGDVPAPGLTEGSSTGRA